jgi:NADPH:quinone reductase-like Zn-dependent oxidoreductase
MKAIVYTKFGSPDTLKLTEMDKPAIDDDGVLVRVRAASLNAGDWRVMRGRPYVGRLMGMGVRAPKSKMPIGIDLAGEVEVVGKNVKHLQPGDAVFGNCGSAVAEYAVGTERSFLPKPARLTFEQAAGAPAAGLTALRALRDGGRLRSGQKVLIIGAGGGVGTFAVQIAKALGAEVTGVCGPANVDVVRSIGADRVIDRTKEDFARGAQRYELALYVNSTRSLSDCRRALTPEGTLVLLGGPDGRWLGPIALWLQALVQRRFVSQNLRPFLSRGDRGDLAVLRDLIEAGKVTPVVDRTYPLGETAAAMRYLESGHARGKVVVTM